MAVGRVHFSSVNAYAMKLYYLITACVLIISGPANAQDKLTKREADSLLYEEVNKPLPEADVKRVVELVSAGADVDVDGETPVLDIVAAKGTSEHIAILIKKGARVNPKSKYAEGPLFKAVEYKNLPVIRTLIDKGIDLDRTNIDGLTAMEYAATMKDTVIFNVLKAKGGNYNMSNDPSILYRVILDGDSAMAEFLMKKGALLLSYEAEDWMEYALMKLKSPKHHIYLVTAIKSIAKPEKYSLDNGASPLHIAAYTGDIGLIKFLRQKGVSLNANDYQKNNALHYAIANNQNATARYLLLSGINTRDESTEGGAALTHLAAMSGNLEMLKEFLKKGNSIFYKDYRGVNTLSYAVVSGKSEMVKYVMDLGVSAAEKDQEGFTARHYAAFAGNLEILELLMEKYDSKTDDAMSLLTEYFYAEGFTIGPPGNMKTYAIANQLKPEVKTWLKEKGVKPEQ
jgi:ankyrin repeat protein